MCVHVCMCVFLCVCLCVCVRACMHVEKTCKFKCVMLFMCICICVSVWVHVRESGDSSVSRILHLRVIDINKKLLRQQLSKEVLNTGNKAKKSK